MQQHASSSEESSPSRQLPKSNSMVQARIDGYLDRACAPLFLTLPQEEAWDHRAEMQSHLESMMTAHIELGYTEIEAVTLTLEQFGKEQSVARAWQEECEAVKFEAGRGTFWSAMRPVVATSLLSGIFFPLVYKAFARMNGFPSFYNMNAGQMGNVGFGLLYAEWLVIPVYLGFLLGRRARGKVFAFGLPALPILDFLCHFFTGRFYQTVGMDPTPPTINPPRPIGEYLLGLAIYYGSTLACAAIGGAIGRWQRRRKLRLAGNR